MRKRGVGFAIQRRLLHMIEILTDDAGGILKLRLSSLQELLNLFCVYAPTLLATAKVKDQFYESLDTAVSKTPATEYIFLLGDFNARVGADQDRILAECFRTSWHWKDAMHQLHQSIPAAQHHCLIS